MDIDYAKWILRGLADGVNPLTSEILPADSAYHDPEIIRALFVILQELDHKAKKDKLPKNPAAVPCSINRSKSSQNAGKVWRYDDEKLLCQLFDDGAGKQEICDALKRTQSGIAAHLKRIGKIQDRHEFIDRD